MSSITSLAELLISKVRDSKFHSATGTAGTGPNKVYGAVLCRGDTAPGNDCASRLSEVLDAAINNSASSSCSSQKNVILFQDGYQAQLIFSDQDFISNAPEYVVRANLNPPPIGDAISEQFDNLVSKMMREFTDVAASKTERHVTGQGWLTEIRKTVYGLVQCTEDMSKEHCQDCLNSIITNRTKMVGYGQLGGAILGLSCSLWYQTEVQFFTGEPMLSINMPTCKFISDHPLVDLAQTVIYQHLLQPSDQTQIAKTKANGYHFHQKDKIFTLFPQLNWILSYCMGINQPNKIRNLRKNVWLILK